MDGMIDDHFLPQYAARAIVDLEHQAKTNPAWIPSAYYRGALKHVASLLRHAVHIILPPNGEIYRTNHVINGREQSQPSPDEVESFNGLPAPVTAFQYAWTHPPHKGEDGRVGATAPRRITIVSDGKQISADPKPDGMVYAATFVSVVYNELNRAWMLLDCDLSIESPMHVEMSPAGYWGVRATARNLVTGRYFDTEPERSKWVARYFGEWKPDIGAAVQCCHALRAGATLDEKTETSATRRRKFDKLGVGGFTYHVLKLPAHVSRDGGLPTGSHASPRFHVRRAHIRKLPTGTLTFVRQCFVGDRERGVVSKHYKVDALA